MKFFRDQNWFLTLFFLALIAGVSLTQLAVETHLGEGPQALEIFQQRPTAQNFRSYEHALEDASWVQKHLRLWAQEAQFSWLKDGGEKVLVGHDDWLFYKPGVQFATERLGIHQDQSTPTDAVTAIVALRDGLSARGVQLIVMPAPNKESIYPNKLTHRAPASGTLVSRDTKALMSGLKAAQVEVIDLFAVFAEAKTASSPSPPLYLTQDSHWSPAGVKLAAQTVARRLIERDWIKSGSVVYQEKPSAVARVGDLVRMLHVPRIERSTVPESIECVQVLRQGTDEPYQNDPASEILVLGDSFMRIYQSDEPGAAGFLAHLAKELKQPIASIVNDGGASTLVRQELFSRPALLKKKKVVLWEFVERDIRLGTEGWQVVPLPPVSVGLRPP